VKINERHAKFVKEYLLDLNATQAAIRAGYAEKSAFVTASKLLSNAKIQDAINKQVKARSERTEVSQDRVLLEIARLAFNDPRKVFDENGALLSVQQWPDEVAAAISSIKVNELIVDGIAIGTTKEIKFWDKSKNLELAGRHLKMFTDKMVHEGYMTVIQASRQDEKL
jgi:phage terminase small subunit